MKSLDLSSALPSQWTKTWGRRETKSIQCRFASPAPRRNCPSMPRLKFRTSRVNKTAHMGISPSRRDYRVTMAFPADVSERRPRLSPSLFWLCRTRTTSHSVGAHGSRTIIPLAAGRAQEARPFSKRRRRSEFLHGLGQIPPHGVRLVSGGSAPIADLSQRQCSPAGSDPERPLMASRPDRQVGLKEDDQA